MNPDDLIMKYIDGELSYNDDVELRKIISLEPKIKEDFDLDVYIHSAIKEDSIAIAPSSKLISSTEDRILMKILASQEVIYPKVKFRRKTYSYAAVIVIFILLNFIYFGDKSLNNNLKFSQLKEQMDLYSNQIIPEINTLLESNSVDLKANTKIGKNIIQPNNNHGYSGINLSNYQSNSENILNMDNKIGSDLSNNTEANNSITKQEQNETSLNNGLNFQNISPEIRNINEELVITNSTTKPMLNLSASNLSLFQPQSDYYSKNNDIQFSSFFGTDIYRNGIPDKKIGISHISQSIAYSINNSQRIGIELGYTEYSYEQTVKVLVPFGSINDEKFIITQFNSDNENDLILYPIKFNKNQQVLWGAAFYEESLLANEYLNLVGRIGGGTTSDGPLGYTRLFAKVSLTRNVSLNLGTEGRLFLGRVPELNSEKSWKSSVSLIYGLQFKF